jgi:hypothetical protein
MLERIPTETSEREVGTAKVLNWGFSSIQDEAWNALAVPGRFLLLQRLFLLTGAQTTAIEQCQECDEAFSSADTGSQHFYLSKSPLSKRRIERTEMYFISKDAFMRYLLVH